jgi:hypothetical protein
LVELNYNIKPILYSTNTCKKFISLIVNKKAKQSPVSEAALP